MIKRCSKCTHYEPYDGEPFQYGLCGERGDDTSAMHHSDGEDCDSFEPAEFPTHAKVPFNPEFHCACDECGAGGHTDADGWNYDPDTGVMLCEHCHENQSSVSEVKND